MYHSGKNKNIKSGALRYLTCRDSDRSNEDIVYCAEIPGTEVEADHEINTNVTGTKIIDVTAVIKVR